MDSDLVSTACFWKTFYQRMAALLVEMKKLEQCRGSSRLRPMLEGNIFRFGAVPECFNVGYTIDAKVTRDCQFLRGLLCLFSIILVFTIICRGLTSLPKVSLNARIVNFSNFVSNESFSEIVRTELLLGKEYNARSLPVKSMHCFQIWVSHLKLDHLQKSVVLKVAARMHR